MNYNSERKILCRGQNGFTLVELVVAIGFFVIILGIVVGGFTHGIRAQRKIASLIAVNNNMSLVLEQIAREIRVGREFCVDVDAASGSCITSIADFDTINQASTDILEFRRLRGSSLVEVRYEWDSTEKKLMRAEGGAVAVPITAGNVSVLGFEFIVSNKQNSTTYPWRITVRMKVAPRNAAIGEMEEEIQTTVAARFLPYEAVASPTIP